MCACFARSFHKINTIRAKSWWVRVLQFYYLRFVVSREYAAVLYTVGGVGIDNSIIRFHLHRKETTHNFTCAEDIIMNNLNIYKPSRPFHHYINKSEPSWVILTSLYYVKDSYTIPKLTWNGLMMTKRIHLSALSSPRQCSVSVLKLAASSA